MDNTLSADEQKTLLDLARNSIISFITNGTVPIFESNSTGLNRHCGCFVTIQQHGKLRGCIGNFVSDKPLCRLVQEMAVAAATHDPRFYPMKAEDLVSFDLEISILSPLNLLQSIDEIQVGLHGLYIVKGASRGVLLPQVAVEYGWNRLAFLQHTCIKAGLPENAWESNCAIYGFTAQICKEEA